MPELIDAHTHIYPRSYIALLKARTALPRVTEHEGGERFVIFPEEEEAGPGGGRPFDESYTSLEHKLDYMDRNGIDRSVVSLGNPWLDPFDGDESPGIARELNAEFAGYGARTAGRIVGMGVLPSNDIADAVAVAREIAATEGLHGVIVGSRICGRSLDDEELEPLWAALEDTGLGVFLHPHYAAAGEQLRGFGHALPVSVGFPFETTIALARLVFAGVLHRHPKLRMLAAHGGAAIPMLAGRMDAAWRSDPSTHERLPEPPSASVARLHLDLVLYQERSMHLAESMVTTDRLAYGTDNPFSVSDPVVNGAALEESFTVEQREEIAEATRKLFGLSAP
ncbi:MAG TPA: amidohydrolase family protein [Terrimesophilobacter sp.]|jgi:Predicted metal-dependent hydrolase of the TIM-barrel fold|uniref:amidohydrolase family protein n=1 Tax=Terrimesophilobacter sp. TaxID=2906435 RepID=UPI002F91F6A2